MIEMTDKQDVNTQTEDRLVVSAALGLDAMLYTQDVCNVLGISRSTLRNLIESKRFPEGKTFNARPYWHASDLKKFEQEQKAAHESKKIRAMD